MQQNQTSNKGMIYMHLLYNEGNVICKLEKQFCKFFSKETKPTQRHLFDLILSVLVLNGFQSVKFNYEHFINETTDFSLNSYYFTLNESKIDLDEWQRNIIQTALSIIPEDCKGQPIIFSIDDTMIEKFGTHFENCATMYDHAAHNGSNYLNGHCFVSLLMSVPVKDNSKCKYISFPISYRMWTQEESKLSMSAQMVSEAMQTIGEEYKAILCCDSWYPKGDVLNLVNKFNNLSMICNARSDTVMYDLPPEKSGKRGRPRKHGEKLSLQDFELTDVDNTDFCIGVKKVLTNIFGDKVVFAIVTKSKKTNSYRLFFSTTFPENFNFNIDFITSESARDYAQANSAFLPLTIYSLRWNIEVSYYEQKSFWALGDYMLRSKIGIERLINLLTLIFSSMYILPYLDDDFSFLNQYSPQQVRFLLGNLIRRQVFFYTFVSQLETNKNTAHIAKLLKHSSFDFPLAS